MKWPLAFELYYGYSVSLWLIIFSQVKKILSNPVHSPIKAFEDRPV